MAVSVYHFDTRIRRRHIPLISQQRRLRHLRSISARNIIGIDPDETDLAFTLHRKPDSNEFYTSETSVSLNPSWKEFESSNFPENVDTALSFVCVKVWNMKDEKQLLVEWVVFLSGLVFLGEQIPKEGKNFKPNTLIFGMSEGYYSCKDCYQHALGNITEASDKESLEFEANGIRKSYTLSTLSRIKTVERAIKQTQAAVNKRRNSINSKLQSSKELHVINAQRELLKIKISVLKTELQSQQRNMDALEKEASSFKNNLLKKRKEMDEKNNERKKLEEKCFELSKFYCEFQESLLKTEAQLNVRRKELISELCCIYPIVEFPDHKGFSIHDVYLPNSESFSGHDETMIAISLGYVCHMLLMISQFLNVPLRYSIHFYGSRSCITDHISSNLPEKTREFPLYSKGKDKRCFEYGVFLLNKNIAQLRIYSGLTTRDLSATLPNLSSLIESRLSVNSETRGIYIAPSKTQPTDINFVLSNKLSQNGFSNLSTEVELPPSQNLLKPSDSEFEILRREMQAMLPNSSVNSHNSLQLPLLSKDASSALSCSLDKGLNDIKLLEKSYDSIKLEEKEPPVRTALHVNYLKLTSHHSSYPNLNAPLQVTETFSIDSQLPSTPPRVWTAESSRTNSEDEPVDDRPKMERQNTVLNDSIFYIPSQLTVDNDLTANMCERIEKAIIEDDFTADLSMRAEQLVSKRSSFQMQRLQPSSADEEPLC